MRIEESAEDRSWDGAEERADEGTGLPWAKVEGHRAGVHRAGSGDPLPIVKADSARNALLTHALLELIRWALYESSYELNGAVSSESKITDYGIAAKLIINLLGPVLEQSPNNKSIQFACRADRQLSAIVPGELSFDNEGIERQNNRNRSVGGKTLRIESMSDLNYLQELWHQNGEYIPLGFSRPAKRSQSFRDFLGLHLVFEDGSWKFSDSNVKEQAIHYRRARFR